MGQTGSSEELLKTVMRQAEQQLRAENLSTWDTVSEEQRRELVEKRVAELRRDFDALYRGTDEAPSASPPPLNSTSEATHQRTSAMPSDSVPRSDTSDSVQKTEVQMRKLAMSQDEVIRVNTGGEPLRKPDQMFGNTKENYVPYGTFAKMFLPMLLERYELSLKQSGEPVLYEKVAPILYWRKGAGAGESSSGIIETTLMPAGSRFPVIEVTSEIDFGRDVLACNLMSDDKEMWKQDLETLHRNYFCPESGVHEIPSTLIQRGTDPDGWKTHLRTYWNPQQYALLDRITNWHTFQETLIQSIEEQMQRHNPTGLPTKWFLAMPLKNSANRRRIAMQLTRENIAQAMAKDGSFAEEYYGQPLFRQETYAKGGGYRFTPGDWVMCDVLQHDNKGGNKQVVDPDVARHAPLQHTCDGKYVVKRIRKVLGGEQTLSSRRDSENGEVIPAKRQRSKEETVVRYNMVRTIDGCSFAGTYAFVEKKRDEMVVEMRHSQEHKAWRMAPTTGLEKRMKLWRPGGTAAPFVLLRKYELERNLSKAEGEGSDGTVWYAKDIQNGNPVFIKLFQSDVDDSEGRRTRALREWAMVKRIKDLKLAPKEAVLEHPIVAIIAAAYGSVEQGGNHEADVCVMVMERCDHDLFVPLSVKQRGKYRFSEPLARFLMRQIVKGVKIMADHEVHHRDLKMENILLKDEIYVKIADFGTATDMQRAGTTRDIGTTCNNPVTSWEINSVEESEYDAGKWDVFQCGAILLQMLCVDDLSREKKFGPSGDALWRQKLYKGQNFREQCDASRDAKGKPQNTAFWAWLRANPGDEFKDLINCMLDSNPASRFSLEQVMEHPALQPHDDDLTVAEATQAMLAKKNPPKM